MGKTIKAFMLLFISCHLFVLSSPHGEDINSLIQKLKDENASIRESALNALVKIGAPAVKPLIAALKDENQKMRIHSAEALGKIKDSRAVEPLIAVLKDENVSVRWNAAEALKEIGDVRAVDPLITVLKDNNAAVRDSAALALGVLKDARAIDPLIAALKDEDVDVRADSARALGRIKDARAVDPLVAAMKDEISKVRNQAAWALGEIKDPRAIEPLIAAMEDDKLRAARAVDPFNAALKDEIAKIKNGVATGEIKDSPSAQALFSAMKDGNLASQAYAKRALEKIRGDRNVATTRSIIDLEGGFHNLRNTLLQEFEGNGQQLIVNSVDLKLVRLRDDQMLINKASLYLRNDIVFLDTNDIWLEGQNLILSDGMLSKGSIFTQGGYALFFSPEQDLLISDARGSSKEFVNAFSMKANNPNLQGQTGYAIWGIVFSKFNQYFTDRGLSEILSNVVYGPGLSISR